MSSNLAIPAGFTAQDLVFEDNFSGTSLNAGSWNTFMASNGNPIWDPNGDGGSGLGATNNADYFMPSEVAVNNGLTLNAVQQSVLGANYVNGQVVPQTFPVTSSVVDTYGKMEFDGGYLQISMQESGGDGAWPALWLLPGAGAGNVGNNFEIDMQEGGFLDGSANPNDVFSYHLHTASGVFGGSVDTGVDLTAGYHTYAINWVPGQSISPGTWMETKSPKSPAPKLRFPTSRWSSLCAIRLGTPIPRVGAQAWTARRRNPCRWKSRASSCTRRPAPATRSRGGM